LRLKGRRREAAREVSRGSSTVGEAGRRHRAPVAGSFTEGKDRTDGRANRP
jgi:hypothetical protein